MRDEMHFLMISTGKKWLFGRNPPDTAAVSHALDGEGQGVGREQLTGGRGRPGKSTVATASMAGRRAVRRRSSTSMRKSSFAPPQHPRTTAHASDPLMETLEGSSHGLRRAGRPLVATEDPSMAQLDRDFGRHFWRLQFALSNAPAGDHYSQFGSVQNTLRVVHRVLY